jgi:hypothetical protein
MSDTSKNQKPTPDKESPKPPNDPVYKDTVKSPEPCSDGDGGKPA